MKTNIVFRHIFGKHVAKKFPAPSQGVEIIPASLKNLRPQDVNYVTDHPFTVMYDTQASSLDR